MANLAPKIGTISDQYNTIFDDTASRYGVQNARSDRREPQTLTSQPTEDGRRSQTKIRYQGSAEVYDFNEEKTRRQQKVDSRYGVDSSVQTYIATNRNSAPTIKFKVSSETKATATLFLVITTSWTGVVWSILQFWAGIMSSLFFGLTAAVTFTYINGVISAIATWFGYTEPNLMALGFWGLVTAAVIGWASLLVAAVHAKLWLLHPLLGRGGALKTGTFILAIILYAIPLLNVIPWVWLWAWAVKFYPK